MKYMDVDAHNMIVASKNADIERLTALVAMQAEALKEPLGFTGSREIDAKIYKALSATAETVSAWKSKRYDEIRVDTLKGAAAYFAQFDCYSPMPQGGGLQVSDELLEMASEICEQLKAHETNTTNSIDFPKE